MLLLPKTPPPTYLKIKKLKDQKWITFTAHKLFYREILLEKATNTGHVPHKKIHKLFLKEIPLEKATYTGHVAHKKNKLFYREILLEKATYTGHVAHKKKQVILQGNSFGKGYVHWTRST